MNSAIIGPLARYPILTFLVATGVLTVLFANAAFLSGYGLIGYAPSLGAIVAAGLLAGRSGIAHLLEPLKRWSQRPIWYVAAIVGTLIVYAISVALTRVTDNNPLTPAYMAPLAILTAFFWPVLQGGLGEEIGWRGYMLPLLQHRWGPIRASIAVGVCWGVWHVPARFVPSTGQHIVFVTLLCIALSCIFTWFYNASGGNLWVLAVLHGCVNGADAVVARVFSGVNENVEMAALVALLAIITVVITRLGCPANSPIATTNVNLR
ncbi:MAG: CPBP family intramembrane metalloprotease [Candidatus Hydrogenedentes bacterium]|nr:CPBP family intramembrane metalloprotease [Candidatus Hydrogenedentota bacterium]